MNGRSRNRTGDTRIFSPVLYQLSYPPQRGKNVSTPKTSDKLINRLLKFDYQLPQEKTMCSQLPGGLSEVRDQNHGRCRAAIRPTGGAFREERRAGPGSSSGDSSSLARAPRPHPERLVLRVTTWRCACRRIVHRGWDPLPAGDQRSAPAAAASSPLAFGSQ